MEILVAIVILAVAVVGMMTALAANTHMSVINRSQARANGVMLAAAEYVESHGWYSCGAATSDNITAKIPADVYTVTVSKPGAVTGAKGSPACTTGVEQVTITVTGSGAVDFAQSQDVVLYCALTVQSDGTCS
ncbi:MAG: hypothetical protein QOD07_2681 [Frankiaceae bacterium]|nr:hypothetical protein [Frankiaceae bacterium]